MHFWKLNEHAPKVKLFYYTQNYAKLKNPRIFFRFSVCGLWKKFLKNLRNSDKIWSSRLSMKFQHESAQTLKFLTMLFEKFWKNDYSTFSKILDENLLYLHFDFRFSSRFPGHFLYDILFIFVFLFSPSTSYKNPEFLNYLI